MKKMINEGSIMKNVIIPIVFLLLFIPFTVQAHTALTSSNPEAGQVLDNQPEQIELLFGTEIEEGSSLTLQGPQGTLETDSLSISGNRMAAPLNSELESGDYIIAWKIIGADGHPIEGEIPFSLELAASEEPAEETAAEEPATDQEKEAAKAEEPAETSTASAETAGGSGLLTTGLIILLVVLAAVAIRLLIKKKR